ncbi:MAG: extradiol ring-cleavage dioxygenase [Acidobacteriota bacterium]|nr:extradiol ring-cleavage dioxygenase [Acidobacteriota bacterium]MDE3191337.1 extradiol ring-cleavage dioxygenase [Acidobacteriota bacterium]
MIVFAAIAPHGDVGLDPRLRAAMEELGRRFDAAAPDVAVVVTPHNVHVEGHFAVVTSGRVGEWETDREAASALLASGLPILGVSYGGNDPAGAEMPLDWGTEVPLGFMRARKVVVVSPARDLPLDAHLRLGEAIAALEGRVALVASADNGHAHDAGGPYGFDPAAARYDEALLEILGSPRLDFRPLALHAGPAKADSLWQLLVLQGALGEGASAELLAYAAPTYYGMAVAEVSA